MPSTEHYPMRDGKHCIELKINQLHQLFSLHDPAPFRDRDLDDDAVEYILGSLREIKRNAPVQLVVYLPSSEIQPHTQQEAADAIHNHFAYEEEMTRKRMVDLLNQGQRFLLIGAVFLSVCLYASYTFLTETESVLAHVMGEGLNIIGWVAMWKPLEILLYDWRPLALTRRFHRQLAAIEIQLVPSR